jgi:hypothetical protein
LGAKPVFHDDSYSQEKIVLRVSRKGDLNKVRPAALFQQWMGDLLRNERDFPKVAVRE